MLVLSNDEIEALLTMEDCLRVLEDAYRSLAQGKAIISPRLDSLMELSSEEGTAYSYKTMGGGLMGRVYALRVNSDVIHWPVVNGAARRVKIPKANGQYVGLIYLYDAITGLPLAIMPDGVIQHMRVGATNGLAARYLAPSDSRVAALLGTGWQAQTQLLALATSLQLEQVRVFSPTPGNVERFCEEMQSQVKPSLVPVHSAEEAVESASVVCSATNSMSPTLQVDWIRRGVHFSTIKAQEVESTFIDHCKLYLHTNRQMKADVISVGRVPLDEKSVGWWKDEVYHEAPDLPGLITGRCSGRVSPDETTLFVNNVGIGLQFAAVGALVVERARANEVGHELPDDWFTERVHP